MIYCIPGMFTEKKFPTNIKIKWKYLKNWLIKKEYRKKVLGRYLVAF